VTSPVAVVLFSGGLGSWATAKRLKERGYDLTLLFTDTRTEDEDLYRWLVQSAGVIDAPLVVLADGRDVWQVFNDENMIGNTRVDICSRILKRDLARAWINANCDPADTAVAMGIDYTEIHRFDRAAPRWLPYQLIAPLCDPPYVDRQEVRQWVKEAGLTLPRLYSWSPHNNCGGFCVKGGHGQFAALLRNMPERYAYHERQEQEFRERTGKDVAILRDRAKGVTVPLTLKSLRERIETGQTLTLPLDDFGGCGCMVDELDTLTDTKEGE
jgi:hypothetical protein